VRRAYSKSLSPLPSGKFQKIHAQCALTEGGATPFQPLVPRSRPLSEQNTTSEPKTKTPLKIFGREFHLPRSRAARIAIGVLLIFFGILGFLPILGFWMIPLGLLVLSGEFSAIRRLRRRLTVWWGRRRGEPPQ
jgi:hypothetical protein